MKKENGKSYRMLALNFAVSICIMYGVMFLNVNNTTHIYLSLTRLYMSLLMVSPMVLLMLWLMRTMYPDKKLNSIIALSSVTVFILALSCLRTQTPISDTQYMKAMIPHHSSAILTSKNANITDPEVRALADSIIASQKEEIEQMKTILERMSNR